MGTVSSAMSPLSIRWPQSHRLLVLAITLAITAIVYGQSPTITTYQYDSVGNRTVATNLLRFVDTEIFSFQPQVALHGQRVNIFGRNMPPGDGSGITVAIDGVPATVLSVAPNVITVEVPQGTMTGPLVVALPGADPVELGTFHIEGVIISPNLALIPFSQSVQFTASVIGTTDPSVTWEVEGIPGGNADVGTITVGGLYTPPDPLNVNIEKNAFFIKATSVELPSLRALAQIQVFGTTVFGVPISIVLPSVGEPGGLRANVTAAHPPVLVVLPGPGGADGLQPNVTVAQPPTLVVLPGVGEAEDLDPNVTVANPPVTVEPEPEP